MDFQISKYKNNPDLLIQAKIQKMLRMEGRKFPSLEKIRTASQLFREFDVFEKKKDDLGISIFRDIICLEFAKAISRKSNLEIKDSFRMVKSAINMKTARVLLDKDAVRTKDAVLFQLRPEIYRKIENYFIKQIKAGAKKLQLPRRYQE